MKIWRRGVRYLYYYNLSALSQCSQRMLGRRQNWTRHSLVDEAAGEVLGRVVGGIEGESVVVSTRAPTAEALTMPPFEAWLRPFPLPTLGSLVEEEPATSAAPIATCRTSVLHQLGSNVYIHKIISFIHSLEKTKFALKYKPFLGVKFLRSILLTIVFSHWPSCVEGCYL